VNLLNEMAWAYVLKGKRYYIGSTLDLVERIKQHERGHTYTTKRIGKWELIWQKEFSNLKEARAAERKIKKWKSTKMIEFLIENKINL